MAKRLERRLYQERVIKACQIFMMSGIQRGQVYAPTGSGKTIMFFKLLDDLFAERESFKVCLVYPRLALSRQQQERMLEFSRLHDVPFTNFNTAGAVLTSVSRAINTTKAPELLKVMSMCPQHVTFSSMRSFPKIAAEPFDLIIFDEAHNMTQKELAKTLPLLRAKKVLFFTATPIFAEDLKDVARGMNNTELFGKTLAEIEPKELIKASHIVGPKIQILRLTTDQVGDDVDTVEAVSLAYRGHMESSRRQGIKVTKMIITSKGLKQHHEIENRLADFRRLVGDPDLDVYAIEASESRLNGRILVNRTEALKQIERSLHNVLLIHYDTIGEGVDISNLTGCMLLRNLSKSKLIQLIGRCCRNSPGKQYATVTYPVIDGESLNSDLQSLAKAFATAGYGDLCDYIVDPPLLPTGDKEPLLDRYLTKETVLSAIRSGDVVDEDQNLMAFLRKNTI